MLSARERGVWALCFLIVAFLLVATGFTSDDPDSKLYAEISARLAGGAAGRWIAPEWWGHWGMEGLFREHPVGVFFLPTVLGAAGIPGVQAAYVVGIGAGLTALLLIGHLVMRLSSREDGRAALVLLQLTPMASIFRIRANHEYPMLVCLLVALIGFDAVRRSWRWWWVAPAALTAALLVKGVFVVIPLLAAAWWVVLNPTQEHGSPGRPAVTAIVAVVMMIGTALIYDAAYARATGEAFWAPYWNRQLGPVTISTPVADGSTFGAHALFYLGRMLWHPAPWTLALAWALWRWRGTLGDRWRRAPERARRGLLFAAGFALTCVLLLSPASRFAERYAFSANYAVAAVSVVLAVRVWPALRAGIAALDRRIPAFPAICWLLLILLRLVVGPLLPRLST